ncbi:hypothetical protein BST97_09360 [Nonlabens spongiae]|uniref:Methylamine utilisation protein MauE domain-containing protein n=1 Tax=Nonlabens spongiae TaxID=331648 RepID=A0A1W6MKS3_9FLAO|nr:MauE/DoxX family redox-associated membrane protein [Nonlabens spongiae]ARN78183.1 hypothetical protein BST97_09360 [Nonlabens spongiae]
MKTFARNTFFELAVLLCWLATFAIGYKAFLFQDDVLTVSLMGAFNSSVNLIIGVITMLMPLGLFLTVKKGKLWFAGTLIIFTVFCLLDVSRLTPYFICYLSLFLIANVFRNDPGQLEKGLIVLLVTVYLFSGLNKFNDQFHERILPLVWFHSLPFQPSKGIGYLVAASEIMFGLLLLFKRTRKLACTLLIFMHVVLLWKLSPFKWNWNAIVYPWNFAMMAVLVFLFRSSVSFYGESLTPKLKTLAILLFVVPALSYVDVLPDNLGYKLYSGNWYAPDFKINKKLPLFQDYDKSMRENESILNPMFYSIQERALAVSPEIWVFERIARNIEVKYGTQVTIKPNHELSKPSR